jgi:DNA-binding NtrC family response regulator
MAAVMQATRARPQVLFVDDEKRVLNSMRIMFRREYDLHLAASGSEALDIVRNEDIDVVVADHRMPQMTGVELLSAVRNVSPRTVRILLTGYADLDAVEGSINQGEVFRFLTKPCPPDQLRETVALATHVAKRSSARTPGTRPAARTTRALPGRSSTAPAAAPRAAPTTPSAAAAARSPAAARSRAPAPPALSRERLTQGLGTLVFTNDETVLAAVQKAVGGRLPVYSATNIVKVVKILTERKPGVLLTDISEDKATIQAMTARLKEHLPELVTIAVSPHRDVLDMVWLINHSQIFRFLRKPLTPRKCAISLQAALRHHRMLLRHPEMVQRYQVESAEDAGLMGSVLSRLKSVRRLWG